MRRLALALALTFALFAPAKLHAGVAVSQPGIGPAPGVRTRPAVAAAGDGMRAFWYEYDTATIRAVALDEKADPLALPFDVAEAGGSVTAIAAASDGHDYLVAWSVSGGATRYLLAGTSHPLPGTISAAVFAGPYWVLATTDGRLHLIDARGVLARSIYAGPNVTLCATGDGRLGIAWNSGASVRFAIVDPTVLLATGVTRDGSNVMSNAGDVSSVAVARGVFLITTFELYSSASTVGTARYGIVDAAGNAVRQGSLPSYASGPAVAAAAGDTFVVVLPPETTFPRLAFQYARIDRRGELLDVATRRLSGWHWQSPSHAAVASGASHAVAVWAAIPHGSETTELRAETISADGSLGHGEPELAENVISIGRPHVERAVAARCEDGIAAAWLERSNFDRLFVRRLADDGTPRDAAPISLAVYLRSQSEPAIACGGGSVLVVWREVLGDVYMRGAVIRAGLPPRFIELGKTPDGATPGVAWDGTTFVAAVPGSDTLRLWRIDRDGFFDPFARELYDPFSAYAGGKIVALAANAAGELLLARRRTHRRDNTHSVSAIRLSLSNDLLFIDEVALSDPAMELDVASLRIAAGPESWLVAWSDRPNDTKSWTHRISELARSGTPIDLLPSSPIGEPSARPDIAVAWTGCAFDIATPSAFARRTGGGVTLLQPPLPGTVLALAAAHLPPGSSGSSGPSGPSGSSDFGSSGPSEGLLDLQSPRGTPRNSEEPEEPRGTRGTARLVLTTDGHQLIARIDPNGCANTRRRATGR